MYPIAKIFVITGILLLGVGLFLLLFHKIPFLGKLPGDIVIERKNVIIFFPIVTTLLISIILTLILNLWIRK